ncbi:MAG: DUF3179 domain-containing protein [Actinobacteria bacterium]|nr:DUF3179 domain-containing protein [Actinomycetota bacterium]
MRLTNKLSRRLLATLATTMVVAASCTAADDAAGSVPPTQATGSAPQSETVDQVAESPVEDAPSGLDAAHGGDVAGLPEPLVPVAEIRSGGPPPDGIPPIDLPKFVPAADVDFLAENEPVMAVEIDGDARAYPVQILTWHEIVNDTVGGVPVAVTYCPLCNSAVAYDRRVEGRVMRFGTSGLLWNSALVMYDRQTETLWSHFTGEAIVGLLVGTELETFPVATLPWGVWRDAHPDGLVLSRDTGYDRDYGSNPYPGYDDVTKQPFLFEGEVDGRFTAMTRVVGIEHDGEAVAIPLVQLSEQLVVPVRVAGQDLTVWWAPGTVSALDAAVIVYGDDIGSTGVFIPVIDETELTFQAFADGFIDDQTGSTWNLLGRAVAGPLVGRQLEAVVHVDTFWFAWSAFRPNTALSTSA